MIILEENFKWLLEAFASELFNINRTLWVYTHTHTQTHTHPNTHSCSLWVWVQYQSTSWSQGV